MSKQSHTPGPWHVSELNAAGNVDPYSIFIEPNIAVIERKVAGQDQNDMADASLIAAAPELLEALRACVSRITDEVADAEFLDEVEQARAAIAKATA